MQEAAIGLPVDALLPLPPASGSSWTGICGTVNVGTCTVVVLIVDVTAILSRICKKLPFHAITIAIA